MGTANELTFSDESGVQRTLTTAGTIDVNNPFFQDMGMNGRTCFTCHRPGQAYGSNCEGADVSTLGKRGKACSLLLTKGLIQIGLTTPGNVEFEIVGVDDPYQCGAALGGASMYRRPLPTTNLGFLSTVMWDGRETVKGQAIAADLLTQASDTTGHAQGAPPSAAQLKEIVDFELALFTAQTRDNAAGSLTADSGHGGPKALSTQPFCIGINDPLNLLPSMPGACATSSGGLAPGVFTLFGGWQNAVSRARQAIARGEKIFNTREFVIDNVGGLNGDRRSGRAIAKLDHETTDVRRRQSVAGRRAGVAVGLQERPAHRGCGRR